MMLNITDFGAVGNGATDDSGAIEAALQTAVNCGGSLYFPKGKYKVTRPLLPLDLANKNGGLRIFGDGPSSQIRPVLAGNTYIFQFGNAAERIVFEDLAFVGDGIPTNADCGAVIYAGYTYGGLVINRCTFAGLRSDSPEAYNYRGLVTAFYSDLAMRDCSFGGCANSYGAAIFAYEFRHVTVENCVFNDYMDFDGQVNRKTAAASALAWIWTRNPNSSGYDGSSEQGCVVVRQSRFDEGARKHVWIDPADGPRILRATVEDCSGNVSGASGSYGIEARNVDRLNVRRYRAAWATGQVRDAISLQGVEVAELEHVYALAGASRISADSTTEYLHLRDCVYGTLDSQAIVTRVETKGVVT